MVFIYVKIKKRRGLLRPVPIFVITYHMCTNDRAKHTYTYTYHKDSYVRRRHFSYGISLRVITVTCFWLGGLSLSSSLFSAE